MFSQGPHVHLFVKGSREHIGDLSPYSWSPWCCCPHRLLLRLGDVVRKHRSGWNESSVSSLSPALLLCQGAREGKEQRNGQTMGRMAGLWISSWIRYKTVGWRCPGPELSRRGPGRPNDSVSDPCPSLLTDQNIKPGRWSLPRLSSDSWLWESLLPARWGLSLADSVQVWLHRRHPIPYTQPGGRGQLSSLPTGLPAVTTRMDCGGHYMHYISRDDHRIVSG